LWFRGTKQASPDSTWPQRIAGCREKSCALSSDVRISTRRFAWVPGVPEQQNWPDNV
jgi:hypothetical protein